MGSSLKPVIRLAHAWLLSSLILACFFLAVPVSAQQSSDGRPLEYIESSSPLPGGGVVTSVEYPGQPALDYPTTSASSSTIAGNPGTGVNGGARNGQSVLVQSAPTGTSGNRIASLSPTYSIAGSQQSVVVQQQPPGVVQQPLLVQQPVVSRQPVVVQSPWVASTVQVPTLGAPTAWNRALRPACAGCGGTSPVYGPANLAGLQPPAAALPPTLVPPANTAWYPGTVTQLPAARTTYTPLVRLQNFPPNAWPGQGIIGSPKLYVDGQPIRNLFRYLTIP